MSKEPAASSTGAASGRPRTNSCRSSSANRKASRRPRTGHFCRPNGHRTVPIRRKAQPHPGIARETRTIQDCRVACPSKTNQLISLPLLRVHQIKYDGSKIWGRHDIRYGFTFNRIAAAGDVPLGAIAPSLSTNIGPSKISFAAAGTTFR